MQKFNGLPSLLINAVFKDNPRKGLVWKWDEIAETSTEFYINYGIGKNQIKSS